jgi:hypothetical protein
MEVLHSMSPEEGVAFLNNFYVRDQGNYEISIDKVIGVASGDKS